MKTKRFAVLGDPVAHSKSPLMHAAAYRALGLDCTYEAIRATPEELPRLVQALREGAYEGFNVTVPHKRRVLDLVDRVDGGATFVGAANTLVRARDGAIVAYNTDVPALAAELVELATSARGEIEWRGSTAIVLGSGGAARAAVAALAISLGVGRVISRARRAVEGAAPLVPSSLDRMTLTVVQATSAGMQGADSGEEIARAVAWDDLPDGAIALDVVYAPPVTPFLRAAESRGLRCANGLGMLARQGALAANLWLGVPPPYEAMLASLKRAELAP
jgi:shikimate dehydrogenase